MKSGAMRIDDDIIEFYHIRQKSNSIRNSSIRTDKASLCIVLTILKINTTEYVKSKPEISFEFLCGLCL